MNLNLLENLFSTKSFVAAVSGMWVLALGMLMIIRNITANREFHWWAMFILIPVFLFWGYAWLSAGRQLPYQISLLFFGLGFVVLTVAAMFLLNLSWERWWPLMIITPALTIFFLGFPSSASEPETAAWVSLMAWMGFSTILLGVTFQVGNFGLIDLNKLTHYVGWWGVFIALWALGAAFNGFWLLVKTGDLSLSVMGLGWTAMMLFIVAILEWVRFEWWRWGDWVAIVSGLILILSGLLLGQKRNGEDAHILEPGGNHPTTL